MIPKIAKCTYSNFKTFIRHACPPQGRILPASILYECSIKTFLRESPLYGCLLKAHMFYECCNENPFPGSMSNPREHVVSEYLRHFDHRARHHIAVKRVPTPVPSVLRTRTSASSQSSPGIIELIQLLTSCPALEAAEAAAATAEADMEVAIPFPTVDPKATAATPHR